jgi:hypothetical protein
MSQKKWNPDSENYTEDQDIEMDESTPKIEGNTSNLISILNFCWTADSRRIFKSPAIDGNYTLFT